MNIANVLNLEPLIIQTMKKMYLKIQLRKWSKYLFHIWFTQKVGKTTCGETKLADWVLIKTDRFLFVKSKFEKNKFTKTCMC